MKAACSHLHRVLLGLTILAGLVNSQAADSRSVSPSKPTWALYDKDPKLSDLFDRQGESQLCFQTSFAQDLIFRNLTSSFTDSYREGINTIRVLTQQCNIDLKDGPVPSKALACIDLYYKANHRRNYEAHLISPHFPDFLRGKAERRMVSIDDIRRAIDRGHGLILEVHWYLFDETSKKWTNYLGHYISVYDYAFTQRQLDPLRLKIVNPSIKYEFGPAGPQFDWVTLEHISPSNRSIYPPNSEFVFRGRGFDRANKIGVLEAEIEFTSGNKDKNP